MDSTPYYLYFNKKEDTNTYKMGQRKKYYFVCFTNKQPTMSSVKIGKYVTQYVVCFCHEIISAKVGRQLLLCSIRQVDVVKWMTLAWLKLMKGQGHCQGQ